MQAYGVVSLAATIDFAVVPSPLAHVAEIHPQEEACGHLPVDPYAEGWAWFMVAGISIAIYLASSYAKRNATAESMPFVPFALRHPLSVLSYLVAKSQRWLLFILLGERNSR